MDEFSRCYSRVINYLCEENEGAQPPTTTAQGNECMHSTGPFVPFQRLTLARTPSTTLRTLYIEGRPPLSTAGDTSKRRRRQSSTKKRTDRLRQMDGGKGSGIGGNDGKSGDGKTGGSAVKGGGSYSGGGAGSGNSGVGVAGHGDGAEKSGSGRDGMMKAPGGGGYILRSDFEANPKEFFQGLHQGGGKK
jgi:hypothetical protein